MECSVLDIGCWLELIVQAIFDIWAFIWSPILDALTAAITAIPVPSWMQNVSFPLPDGVLWFANALELPAGAAIMTSAWTIRFLIRRIPFIG